MKKRHDFKGDTDIAVCLNKIINHIHFTKTLRTRDYAFYITLITYPLQADAEGFLFLRRLTYHSVRKLIQAPIKIFC